LQTQLRSFILCLGWFSLTLFLRRRQRWGN